MKNPLTLPSIDDVKKGIDELLLFDKWDDYKIKSSPKKFQKRFHQLFTSRLGIMPHVIQETNNEVFPFKMYRIRKKTKSMNERLISEYWYPPIHTVKKIQRANIPYYPVLYASDRPLTAIYETVMTDSKRNSESVYYLSEWSIRPNVKIKICPMIFGNVDPESRYKMYSDTCIEKLRADLKEYSDKEIEGFEEILKFLCNLFVFNNTYVVSSYLAHSNLYADHVHRPDILIYPSIQNNKRSVNFAVHPNTVIEKLCLERVFKFSVKEFENGSGLDTIIFNHVGRNIEGNLLWRYIGIETEEGRNEIEHIQKLFELNS